MKRLKATAEKHFECKGVWAVVGTVYKGMLQVVIVIDRGICT